MFFCGRDIQKFEIAVNDVIVALATIADSTAINAVFFNSAFDINVSCPTAFDSTVRPKQSIIFLLLLLLPLSYCPAASGGFFLEAGYDAVADLFIQLQTLIRQKTATKHHNETN